MKKRFLLLLVAAMLLTFCACGNRAEDEDEVASYSEAIKTVFAVRFEGKVERLKDLAPREYWDWMEENRDRPLDAISGNYQKSWEEQEKHYIEDYGSDYKVTHRIKKEEKLDEETVNGIALALEETYGVPANKVKAGYTLDISAKISGSEGEDEAELEFTVIQIGGMWYVVEYVAYSDGYEAHFSTPT